MLIEEAHSAGVADKVHAHEDAAHEKRNWVRLTFDCNDHCVFCLDAHTHNGEMRSRDEVKEQIIDGKRKGATRLILSGGEPTIHPDYVDFVRLGRLAGYSKIQTVTNGRLFSYGTFLDRCIQEGLSDITFSIHGPNAKIHDALVGTKGAFEQEVRALATALADGRPIVNVDIVVNRVNVRHLPRDAPALLRDGREGVRSPPGRSPSAARSPKDATPSSTISVESAALPGGGARAFSKRPDIHIWMNRFLAAAPRGLRAPHPGPLQAERRGARSQRRRFARLFSAGVSGSIAASPRAASTATPRSACATRSRVSSSRWRTSASTSSASTPRGRLRSLRSTVVTPPARSERATRTSDRSRSCRQLARHPPCRWSASWRSPDARTLHVCAPDVAAAKDALASFPRLRRLELELGSYAGMEEALEAGGAFADHVVDRARVRTVAEAEALLATGATFEVAVELSQRTAPWLLSLAEVSPRLSLWQPNHERVTDARAEDVDLAEFFSRFRAEVPVDNVPACILGRRPRRPARDTLDTAIDDLGMGASRSSGSPGATSSSTTVTKSLRCGAVRRERAMRRHATSTRSRARGGA